MHAIQDLRTSVLVVCGDVLAAAYDRLRNREARLIIGGLLDQYGSEYDYRVYNYWSEQGLGERGY